MTELSGKRIVMTGATGFIGSHVAKRFLDEGAEVYCLVRPESRTKRSVFRFMRICSRIRWRRWMRQWNVCRRSGMPTRFYILRGAV